jgi:hypothetical protein
MSELSDAQCDRILDALDADGTHHFAPVTPGFPRRGLFGCDHSQARRETYPSGDWWMCPCGWWAADGAFLPPARGTHSSDYPSPGRCPCGDATTQTARYGPVPGQTYEAHLAEYEQAARWSRGL